MKLIDFCSDVGCKTVANMIKGKTPEEIRKLFNIVNDFTPEEEVRVCLSAMIWPLTDSLFEQAQIKKENVSHSSPIFLAWTHDRLYRNGPRIVKCVFDICCRCLLCIRLSLAFCSSLCIILGRKRRGSDHLYVLSLRMSSHLPEPYCTCTYTPFQR